MQQEYIWRIKALKIGLKIINIVPFRLCAWLGEIIVEETIFLYVIIMLLANMRSIESSKSS